MTKEELRALAEKATAGPWEVLDVTEHHGVYVEDQLGRTICDLYYLNSQTGAVVRQDRDLENAAYIAAASPDRVLALLDEVERLRAGVAQAEDWFRAYERQHRAKCSAEGDAKAQANKDRADYLAALLTEGEKKDG